MKDTRAKINQLTSKMTNALICSSILLGAANASAQKEGTNSGGGGGFICAPNETCKTLAEAGLKIKVSSSESGPIKMVYTIPLEVVNEVKTIFSQVAFPKWIKDKLLEKVTGEYGTYQLVEEVDSSKFSKIKVQYEKVVRDQASSVGMKYFELAAWSDTCVNPQYPDRGNENAKTYLLPRFEKLSLRQKALNLIHEANYRARCADKLDMVLAFDAKLEELLSNPKMIYDKNYDLIDLAIIFKNLGWDYGGKNSVVFLMEMLKRKNHGLLRLDSFCNTIDQQKSSCRVSYEKLIQLANIDKRIPQLMQGIQINLLNDRYQDMGLTLLPQDSPIAARLVESCNSNFDVKASYSALNSLLMTVNDNADAAVSANALGLDDLRLLSVQCVPQEKIGSWDIWYSPITLGL